jgi:hypothetical protein
MATSSQAAKVSGGCWATGALGLVRRMRKRSCVLKLGIPATARLAAALPLAPHLSEASHLWYLLLSAQRQ